MWLRSHCRPSSALPCPGARLGTSLACPPVKSGLFPELTMMLLAVMVLGGACGLQCLELGICWRKWEVRKWGFWPPFPPMQTLCPAAGLKMRKVLCEG